MFAAALQSQDQYSSASVAVAQWPNFVEGQSIGACTIRLDESLLDAWLELYPSDAQQLPMMPVGMASVLMMRAGMEIISPRPDGMLHVAQSFSFQSQPRLHDDVRVEFMCQKTRTRGQQRWLYLLVEACDKHGNVYFSGTMKVIWPLDAAQQPATPSTRPTRRKQRPYRLVT